MMNRIVSIPSRLFAVLVLMASFWITSASTVHGAGPAPSAIGHTLDPADFDARHLLVVHYHRPDAMYDQWNLWLWPEGGDGRHINFSATTDYGPYAIIPFNAEGVDRVGLIVRKGNWEAKDIDGDRFIDLDEDAVTEIWLVSGDHRIYTDPAAIDLSIRTLGAFLDAPDLITLAATGQLSDPQLTGLSIECRSSQRRYEPHHIVRSNRAGAQGVLYDIRLRPEVDPRDVASLTVNIPEFKPHTVYARDVLNDDPYVALDAELGNRYSSQATSFQVWSPVAEKVDLLLYEMPNADSPTRTIPMTRAEQGLWRTQVRGDLHGTQYQIRFFSYGKHRTVPDIHCYAATADSQRSIVLDLDRTDPDGWTSIEPPSLAHMTDEIIYEVHVRDYSIRDPACPPEYRGTYLGLIHEHPAQDGSPSSGLSHLQDLGITAVHLLPIHDYPSESGEYNWGYWTTLFNVAEGNYTTEPHDPTSALRELKTAILALHRAGIRVILDVVYNHTSSSGEWSPFDQSVPFYYFRTTPDGRLRNDAGVGNSMADERPMVRKYIIDSLKYWTNECRVDGFRFDLVGTHHPATVRAIVETLKTMRPDLTLYGEPWTGGGPIQFGKGAQRGLEFAVFNDHLRNAIRGDLDGAAIGFATGPGGDRDSIVRGVFGAIDDFTEEPIESVSYASAHDNLTLWDKITKVQPGASDEQRRNMQKLALGIVLTSQGMAFLHGGSDFCRTKQGNHNSYNAGDDINAFDWSRKAEYIDVFAYVAGLIELRRAHPAFRMHDDAMIRKHLRLTTKTPVISYLLNGRAVGDSWGSILVAYNGDPIQQTIQLPEGRWTQVVDADRAGTAPIRQIADHLILPPYSMAVLHQ